MLGFLRRRSITGVGGRFQMEHRHPDFGLLWQADLANGFTLAALDYLLRASFKGGSQSPTWYIGAIAEGGYGGVSTSDTHASHPTWVEFTGLSARGAWQPGAPNGGVLASPTPTVIPVTVGGQVRGVFLADRSAVGDTSPLGVLCSTAVANDPYAVVAGGHLSVSYLIRGRPVGG